MSFRVPLTFEPAALEEIGLESFVSAGQVRGQELRNLPASSLGAFPSRRQHNDELEISEAIAAPKAEGASTQPENDQASCQPIFDHRNQH